MDFKFVMFDDDTDDTGPAIGDIVSLASGSPDMTVISVCECGTVEVAWYDDNGMNIDVFPVGALVVDDD